MILVLILAFACLIVIVALIMRLRRKRHQPQLISHENLHPVRIEQARSGDANGIPFASTAHEDQVVTEANAAVLIVDDQALIRVMLRDLFELAGIEVYEAHSGLAALETIRRHKIHYVLLDLNMPEMDGLEALTEIRRTEPRLPVALMTAMPDSEMLEEAHRLGIEDCFVKPFDINEIRDRVMQRMDSSDKR